MECESIRGQWGGICPDCGQRLPGKPEPLRSWQSQREPPPQPRRDARPVALRAQRTPRDIQMVMTTVSAGGSRARAAAQLGVTVSAISHAITRMAATGDEDAIMLRARTQAGTVLTERQREAIRILAKHGGNRHAAAAELGIAPPSLFSMLARLRARGVTPEAYSVS